MTDPRIAEPIHHKLAGCGRQVTTTRGAATVQHRAAQQPIDLVIIDRESAGDDLQTLSSFHDAQPRVPIIVLAAHPSKSDCLECVSRGAVDSLPTSVLPEELTARARAHLRVRRHDTPTDPVRLRVGGHRAGPHQPPSFTRQLNDQGVATSGRRPGPPIVPAVRASGSNGAGTYAKQGSAGGYGAGLRRRGQRAASVGDQSELGLPSSKINRPGPSVK